jgi:hypothetical protein
MIEVRLLVPHQHEASLAGEALGVQDLELDREQLERAKRRRSTLREPDLGRVGQDELSREQRRQHGRTSTDHGRGP